MSVCPSVSPSGLAMSVGPSVRNQPYVCQSIHMNTVISETIKAAILEYSITFKHDYTEKIKTFSNRVFIPVTLRVKGYIISVTRRVKGYARFVGKYETGRRKCFRPHKVYIFFIRITSELM